MKQPSLYRSIIIGGGLGTAASFLQLIEKLALLKNKDAILNCDISAVFSCSNVLSAWQSSVFGFPNSMVCLLLFTFTLTIGIAGLGGKLSRRLRFTAQAFAVATLLFAIWFLLQSIWIINALCILCLFCFSGLLLVNWAWIRINMADYRLPKKMQTKLNSAVRQQYDILLWLSIGLTILLLAVIQFA